MTILRRTAALFLLGFAFILFFLGGLLRTVDTLVGSGSKISDSATSILSTTGGSEAIADALITQLTKDADPTVKAVMIFSSDTRLPPHRISASRKSR